jgi:hypothetical protein
VARGEEAVDDVVAPGAHAEGLEVEVRVGNLLKQPATVEEDCRAVKEAVEHGKGIARAHRHVEVDLAGLVDELHGQGGTEVLDPQNQVGAIILAKALQGGAREHADNVTPHGGGDDNVAELANLAGGLIVAGGIKVLGERLNMDGIAEGEVDVRTRQGNVGTVVRGQGRVAAGGAGEEAVEDVDQPQGAAGGLIAEELVVALRGMMAVENAVHLQHAGRLAEVDVSADGIASAPFVDDDEAEGLDVSEDGVVQILVDETNGLGGKGFGGSGGTAVASDQAW